MNFMLCMVNKTKEQLFHENTAGLNVGVPSMESIKQKSFEEVCNDFITEDDIKLKRPELNSWYFNNYKSKDKKIKSIINQIHSCINKVQKTVDFLYTGHEAFGGGTMQQATFCFRLYKKEILNIVLI